MPRKSVRRRRRSGGLLSAAIKALMVVAIILVSAILITNYIEKNKDPDVVVKPSTGTGNYINPDDTGSNEHQLVLDADTFLRTSVPHAAMDSPSPSPTPALTPTPSPTPEPTYNPDEPYALVRPTASGEGFLPIFEKANTDKKMIAITVDECSSAKQLTTICKLAVKYDAKLTLFPTGESIMKSGISDLLKQCVFKLGFEIENRCYTTNSRLYQMNDMLMATEIWKQNMALSYSLGVKYEPHFLRVYGGNGDTDQRTHAYLIQEDYVGFAGWTISGTDTELEKIGNKLAPGNIYYFKATESDAKKIYALMLIAKEKGYEMVTLNELFGYEANKYYEVEGSILTEVLPQLEGYDDAYYDVRVGDYAWAAYKVQNRLVELGYLPTGSADGIFGSSSAEALSAFQAKCEIAASGVATVQTQERLFASDAPAKNSQ